MAEPAHGTGRGWTGRWQSWPTGQGEPGQGDGRAERESLGGRGPCALPVSVYIPIQVKMAYVNFVNHCYVDTEVEMKEIYTSNHIWTLFENFTLDMARVGLGKEEGEEKCGSSLLRRAVMGYPPAPHLGRPQHLPMLFQVCNKREKRLADPTLEKYVLTVVLDTVNAFFSSPFSENSTSLQVHLPAAAALGDRGDGWGDMWGCPSAPPPHPQVLHLQLQPPVE